jgi:hypothetical protein
MRLTNAELRNEATVEIDGKLPPRRIFWVKVVKCYDSLLGSCLLVLGDRGLIVESQSMGGVAVFFV